MKAVKGLGRSAASQKSLCSIKKTRTQKTGVSFLKKLLVSRNELRELENIDARHLDVLIAFCLLQVQKKTAGEQYVPTSLRSFLSSL